MNIEFVQWLEKCNRRIIQMLDEGYSDEEIIAERDKMLAEYVAERAAKA